MATDPIARLEVFIGTWNTRGRVLATDASPATTLVATDVYRWGPGRRFVVHDVDARFGDDVARSMEVIGHDPLRRRLVARSYDDRGASEAFDVTLRGRRWRIDGKSVRFDGAFDASRDRLTGLWELRSRRSRWQPWIELELVRA